MTAEQFADQLKTRLKLYQFEMEERGFTPMGGISSDSISIEGVIRIIDRTLQFKNIDQIEGQNYQALSGDEFVGRLKKALKP